MFVWWCCVAIKWEKTQHKASEIQKKNEEEKEKEKKMSTQSIKLQLLITSSTISSMALHLTSEQTEPTK